MRRWVPVTVAVAMVLSVLASSGSAPAVGADRAIPNISLPDGSTDVRELKLVPPHRSAALAARSLASRLPGLQVKWNARLGTVKHVFVEDGYLSKSAGGVISEAYAVEIARAWIDWQRDLFGLSASAVRSLKPTRVGALSDGGAFALVFRQHYGSIPTFAGGTVGVNLTRDGRVVSVWADTGPTGTLASAPALSAAEAVRVIARREGVVETPVSLGARSGGDRLSLFTTKSGVHAHNARLVAFPTASGPRLAWRVFFAKDAQQMLSTAVDAATGSVLMRNNQVSHASGDKGTVFRNHPGAPKGGRQEVVSFEGDRVASPQGWVGQVPTTVGNNVLAFTDWRWSGLVPVALGREPVPQYAPVSPTRDFAYSFSNAWGENCTPAVTTAVSELVQQPTYMLDRDAAVTNLFYFGNVIHDYSYRYGFTEAFGNMQTENYSGKGFEHDAIRFMSQAGSLTLNIDNAFMHTPADGGEPTQFVDPANPTKILSYSVPYSGMFLWAPVSSFQAPCVDGSFDASTAYHEYTHGISNRLSGGPDDADALAAHQSGSMGEGWSDWVAHVILDSQNIEDRGADGIYITGNTTTGIRHFPLNKNPLTYGDLGFGTGGPEVHDDGEIWSGALWDLRNALVRRYGKAKGLDRVSRLVFDGMAMQPRLPDMLDARDAILRSAQVRYRGADTALIWSVFAKRGMGRSARSKDASDVNPRPGFDAPSGNGFIAGQILDSSGQPMFAKILIGFGEGKPTPVTVTDTAGRFRLPATPGVYPMFVAAAGYGTQKLGAARVSAGGTVLKNARLNRNLASAGWGATVTGLAAGDPGLALVDDHDFTGQILTLDEPAVIRLAGSGLASVSSISLIPKPSNGGTSDNVTLYEVALSADGRTWKTVMTGGVKKYKPRPIATTTARVSKTLGGMKARFARVTALGTLGGQETGILAGLEVFGTAPGMKVTTFRRTIATGSSPGIAVANAGAPDTGVTATEFLVGCSEPVSNGVDSYVLPLPEGSGNGTFFFETKGGSEPGRDLDIFFYDATCGLTGVVATPSADEFGAIPPGSAWALVVLFAGTTEGFDYYVRSTIENVVPPRGVGYAKPVRARTVVEREYVGVPGDVGEVNCTQEVSTQAPSFGAVCIPVKSGDRVKVEVKDDFAGKVSGFYRQFTDAGLTGSEDELIAFCGGFDVVIKPTAVSLDVYFDDALVLVADCESEPATTGVVAATFG